LAQKRFFAREHRIVQDVCQYTVTSCFYYKYTIETVYADETVYENCVFIVDAPKIGERQLSYT